MDLRIVDFIGDGTAGWVGYTHQPGHFVVGWGFA
jgi:hypothetical protein